MHHDHSIIGCPVTFVLEDTYSALKFKLLKEISLNMHLCGNDTSVQFKCFTLRAKLYHEIRKAGNGVRAVAVERLFLILASMLGNV